MSHHSSVFYQLPKLIPEHKFETSSNQHHSVRSFHKASRWSQFVAIAMGQLAERNSLRDIIQNLSAQAPIVFTNWAVSN